MKLIRIGLRFGITLALSSVSLLLFVSSAKADGWELLGRCNKAEKAMDTESFNQADALDMGYCLGFVAGIGGLLNLNRQLESAPTYCPPKGVTNEQGVQIITKYLRQNAEKLDFTKSKLVVLALTEAFPCKP